MLHRFMQNIAEQHLLPSGEKVLLAVSGGRDSVCMAYLFHQAGLSFAIAHCNFHLRPNDCDRDQQFVRQLAQQLGAEFYTTDFDTRQYAASHHLGIEAAARQLRYHFFLDICRHHNLRYLATAHHSDDNIETLLLNLFRGTGIAGLHGILPLSHRGPVTLIRPMLLFSRQEIDYYVQQHHIPYVEDLTNHQPITPRNRIRHQLMPLLRQIYPSFDNIMLDNIDRFRQTELLLLSAIDNYRQQLETTEISPLGIPLIRYYIPQLLQLLVNGSHLPAPISPLITHLLRPYGFSPATVERVIAALPTAQTGTRFLSRSHIAVIDRNYLLIGQRRIQPPPTVRIQPLTPGSRLPAPGSPLPTPGSQLIDADLVHLPLTVRHWQPGDRFCPLGMSHQRLLSDFLKDAKLNIIEKNNLYLLVDADDRIVWVIPLRIDNRFRITPNTRSVLQLQLLTPDS